MNCKNWICKEIYQFLLFSDESKADQKRLASDVNYTIRRRLKVASNS